MVSCCRRELADLQSPVFWRDVLVETLISFILIFFIVSTQVVYSESFQMTPTHAGIMMGLLVFVLIESFGHMSGAHMNPAVSLLFFCKRDITFSRTLIYTIAQVAGGGAGAKTMAMLASPEKRAALVPMRPADSLSVLQAVCVEVMLTFCLCVAILGSGDKRERKHPCPLPGLPVGLMVAVSIMAGATWTGASMNPLVALGPDIASGQFEYFWIYWLGPAIGSVLAYLIYTPFSLVHKKFAPTQQSKTVYNPESFKELKETLRGLLNEDGIDFDNNKSKRIYDSVSLTHSKA